MTGFRYRLPAEAPAASHPGARPRASLPARPVVMPPSQQRRSLPGRRRKATARTPGGLSPPGARVAAAANRGEGAVMVQYPGYGDVRVSETRYPTGDRCSNPAPAWDTFPPTSVLIESTVTGRDGLALVRQSCASQTPKQPVTTGVSRT